MKIYLHTGSNIGDRYEQLAEAIAHIEQEIGKVTSASSIYETEPWGNTDQPNFFNQALEVDTNCEPIEVLDKIHEIEERMGRVRTQKWAKRNIDIDLIFYGTEILKSEKLTIPHAHMHERNFVLIPIMEIAGEFVHPELGETIEELYIRSDDTLEVIMLEKE